MVRLRYPALMPFVKFFRKGPNADVIKILATANVFLLFNYFDHPGTKIYTTSRSRGGSCSASPAARRLEVFRVKVMVFPRRVWRIGEFRRI
jgi:hypothetical protein